MIRCNLAVLMAEQNLKITKVAIDTGISRTTLTALASNSCQGVQLETMNKLCLYLKTTPDKLFSFYPINIDIFEWEVKKDKDGNDVYLIRVSLQESKLTSNFLLYGTIRSIRRPEKCYIVTLSSHHSKFSSLISFPENLDFGDDYLLNNAVKRLPDVFKGDVENTLIEKIFSDYDKDCIAIEWNLADLDDPYPELP